MLANGITNNSFAYHNESAIGIGNTKSSNNITGNTATGTLTFLEFRISIQFGIVAYNTTKGPFNNSGRNLEKKWKCSL